MRRKIDHPLRPDELAALLGARLDLPADASADAINGIQTLEAAGPTELALVAGEKYLDKAQASRAGAFLTTASTAVSGRVCLVVDQVWPAALRLFDLWHPDERPPAGVHPSAVTDPAAQLGEGVAVGPLAVIEAGAVIGRGTQIGAQCFIGRDARIGEDCLLHPGVRVLERVRVGRRVILHPGVVLGADGFGYEVIDGRGVKIPQVGTVVIEDDVEIGANTCIDRAFLDATRIGSGTKIDNLVQIAHNVRIGRMCGLAAQVGIAGSTTVGDGSIFWGQAGIKDNLRIGSGVVLMGQCAPTGDVPDGTVLVGSPGLPLNEMAKIFSAERRLPELLKRVRTLEKKAGG